MGGKIEGTVRLFGQLATGYGCPQFGEDVAIKGLCTDGIRGNSRVLYRIPQYPAEVIAGNLTIPCGSVLRNYCEKCYQFYGIDTILNSTGIPRCEKCGGIIKPDVVLYEEGLDEKTLNAAVRYIHEADVLIIGGTSLAVYPAAGLIDYFQGDKLVVINKSATPRDSHADLLIQGPIGEVFQSIQNP